MTLKHAWKKGTLVLCLVLTALFSGCNKETNGTPATPTPVETQNPNAVTSPTENAAESQTTEQKFDKYIDDLFKQEIVLNTVNLHYTLAHPENYGITEYEPDLGSFSVEEMKASYEELRQMKTELQAFHYDELKKEQQVTYDILLDYINTELSAEEMILYTEVLSPVTGYQAQLPVLLAEYKFRTVQDVEDYLALVAQVDEVFAELVEFEQEKSKAGLFMPDYAAEAIIDQCRRFIETPEENYMIEVFKTEIEAVEGLSQDEKQAYITKNTELVTTELVSAYQTLIDGLEALKGTGTNDKGLCYFEDGKQYYEYLVRSLTGSSKSVEKLMKETQGYIDASIFQIAQIATQNPGIWAEWDSYAFCETEPDKILKDLMEKMQEDFPEIPETNYTIKYVHPSMVEHMSPAFYLTPPIDDAVNNVIYINPSYVTEYLYTTMAHEGYPGHLYQTVYSASKGLPLIRNMFSNQGYSEGWATYVEYYSYQYAELNEDLAKVLPLNDSAVLGIYAYVDMGIHYLGWDVEKVKEYMVAYGLDGGMNQSEFETAVQEVFENMIEEPGNYLSYFIGYLEFINLREVAEEVWGANYTVKRFHEAVLSMGAAPFDLLEKAIRNYEW